MKRAIRPNQKTGAEMPKSAKPIAKRSNNVRRLTAESTPIATPNTSQSVAAPAISHQLRGLWLPAGKAQRGVAVRQLEEHEEGDEEHGQDDDDRPDEAACDVDQHRVR